MSARVNHVCYYYCVDLRLQDYSLVKGCMCSLSNVCMVENFMLCRCRFLAVQCRTCEPFTVLDLGLKGFKCLV